MITYEEWYKREDVLWEILKQTMGKEMVLLGEKRVRNINAKSMYHLKSNLKAYDVSSSRVNLYKSFANLQNMPVFSFQPNKRKKESEQFNLEFLKYMVNYDLGFDFDAHEGQYDLAFTECRRLKKLLDKHLVPYSLKWSGSGLHIDIRHENLPSKIKNENDCQKKVILIQKMCSDIATALDLKTMDVGRNDEGVPNGSFYTARRIWKIAYSWDIKTDRIALPLSDAEFERFDFMFVTPAYVNKNIIIQNRGLLERQGMPNGLAEMCKKELGVCYD